MENSLQTLQVSWQDIDIYCDGLYQKILERDFKPDIIVTPLRGGAIPAVILSHKFGIRNMLAVQAKRTEDDSIEAQKHTVEINFNIDQKDIQDKNVLLVDEILDTGDTLLAVYEKIQAMKPKGILSAVIFAEKDPTKSIFRPDIFLLSSDKWVVFPWEQKP